MENSTGNLNISKEYLNLTSTQAPIPKTSSSATGLTDTFYISLFLLYIPGIVTNLISVTYLSSEARKSRVPTNSLLLMLCTTDFVAVSLSCFWHTSARLEMPMTYEFCAVKSFFHPLMPLMTGSVSLLMAMDRVLAFCKPFYYRTNVNKRMWFIYVILVLSVMSVICILPHLGYGSLWTASYRGGKVSYTCSVFTYQTEPSKKIFHVIYLIVGLLLIAGIVICNVVVAGAVLLLRHRTMEAQKSVSNQSTVSRATELKFALIVGFLAVAFVTSWLPFNVWILYKLLNIPMDLDVVTNIHLLGGINYSTDPFVYLIIRKSNRKVLARLFCCRTTLERKVTMSTSINGKSLDISTINTSNTE